MAFQEALQEDMAREYSNRLFIRHGHKCEIEKSENTNQFYPKSKNLFKHINYMLFKLSTISELNPRARHYLKSQSVIAQERERHYKYPYMIHPFSDMKAIWEVFMIVIYFFQFITIPLDLCHTTLITMTAFQITFFWAWLRNILDLVCCFDVILNFYTGYFIKKERQVIIEPGRVVTHYLKTYFLIDLISSIPTYINLLVPFIDARMFYKYIRIMVYVKNLKILCYVKFSNLIYNSFEVFNLSLITYRLISISITSILYLNFNCCVMLYSLAISLSFDSDGIYAIGDDNKKEVVTTGYFHTLYLTVVVLSRAGCSIKNITYGLKVVLIMLWITSNLFYIYLLAKVMEIVMILTASSHKYVEMVGQLREYMRSKKLPEHMQKHLLRFYEFRFQKTYFKESDIFNIISSQLKQEIVMHNCKMLVENVNFFNNLPTNLLIRIVTSLKTAIFLANDVIIKAKAQGDCMYFISTGTVAVYSKSGREICHLEDGSHFGEIALVMKDQLRTASVVAIEISELLVLEHIDFVRAIHPYPDLLNKIKRIAADRLERISMLDEFNRRELYIKKGAL